MRILIVILILLITCNCKANAGPTLNWDRRQSEEMPTTIERINKECTGVDPVDPAWTTIATIPLETTTYIDNTVLVPRAYCYRVNEWFTLSILQDYIQPAQPSWLKCADEGGFCAFTGTKQVRYGSETDINGVVNPVYSTLTINGDLVNPTGSNCDNATFGDPVYGVVKHCDTLQ